MIDRNIRFRYAIVGGGTVGLYIASRLSQVAPVLLFEAGGDLRDAAHSIASPEIYRGVNKGRGTGLGGTSTLWGGQLWPWQPWEAGAGYTGYSWPIDFAEEVATRYAAVLDHLGLDDTHDRIHRKILRDSRLLSSDDPDLDFRYSTWIARRERNLAVNTNITRRLVDCSVRLDTAVERISPVGRGFEITSRSRTETTKHYADVVILAAGTIGNVKALAKLCPSDPNVGRGFMDHVSARTAKVRVKDWARLANLAAPKYINGVRTTLRMATSQQYVERTRELPGYGHFEFASRRDGIVSAAKEAVSGPIGPSSLWPLARKALREAPSLAASGVRAARHRERPIDRKADVYLRVDVEQPRRADVHISFAPDRRAFPELSWHVGQEEHRSAELLTELLCDYLGRSGVGDTQRTDVQFGDIFHLMGGTSMGRDPNTSVVDANLQAHKVENLYVAGASVFPTGGMANPTFTALALAERLVNLLHD